MAIQIEIEKMKQKNGKSSEDDTERKFNEKSKKDKRKLIIALLKKRGK